MIRSGYHNDLVQGGYIPFDAYQQYDDADRR